MPVLVTFTIICVAGVAFLIRFLVAIRQETRTPLAEDSGTGDDVLAETYMEIVPTLTYEYTFADGFVARTEWRRGFRTSHSSSRRFPVY